MDMTKPIPKPRSTTLSTLQQPIPAPRNHSSQLPTLDKLEIRQEEPTLSSLTCSCKSSCSNLSKNCGTQDEISEKISGQTDQAVIMASNRFEKTIKNILTKRLNSFHYNNDHDVSDQKKVQDQERCISMPTCDDIFSSISFYSPLLSNLKSMKNEENLSESQYSPPPPMYSPPSLPDESIYDELKSVHNSDIVDSSESNCKTNSQQDLIFPHVMCDGNCTTAANKLSRSDSWAYYTSVPNKSKISTTSSLSYSNSSSSNSSTLSVRNSLYENWKPREKNEESYDRDPIKLLNNKSVLFEFDPFLKKNDEITYSNFHDNDLTLLEALLASNNISNPEEENEIDKNSLLASPPPPAPPKRYDSLPKNEYDEVEIIEKKINKNQKILEKLMNFEKRKQPAAIDVTAAAIVIPSPPLSPHKNIQNSFDMVSSTMRQKLKKIHDSTVQIKPNMINFIKNKKLLSKNKEEMMEIDENKMTRPKINMEIIPVCHRGIVYCPGIGIERSKDLVLRVAVLMERKIIFYTDKSMTTIKEILPLDTVQSVHLLQDIKMVDGEMVFCIAISCEDKNHGVNVFYIKNITERRIWAQRILEALTPIFPIKYTSDYTKVGWAYLKEGVTGTWFSAWVLLQQRILIYTHSLNSLPLQFETLDLRKTRCILIRNQEDPVINLKNTPVLLIDNSGRGAALHLTAPGIREVPAWRHAIYQAATNCGPALDNQQLTIDNVPVIVDKCINFIYAHGIMSEGIYRKGGSSSAVVRLLEAFRKDAWATQITRDLYSEHDVATVLRRFLRDLPDPILPCMIHDALSKIIDISDEQERAGLYREILFPVLNDISGSTLQRILAHLHCLCQQSSRNLMTVENISAIWGPTLMHDGEKNITEWNKCAISVVGDLIRIYPKIYKLSSADLIKEAKILEVLERHHILNNLSRPTGPSGDLKIWVYLFEKDGQCFHVTIGPQKTAGDICQELSEKSNILSHELCIEEHTLSGALVRPLVHSEKVLQVIARWGYWDLQDRQDNVLILKKDTLIQTILPLIKPPMTMSGELKFADTKSKQFKTFTFEFSQAKLCCYKDRACAVKLYEWKIEDMVWYLGHETKRNPQTGWSITFLLKNIEPMRTKDAPYFGYILAGASIVEQNKWLAAMLFGEYQLNLLPSAINLMDS